MSKNKTKNGFTLHPKWGGIFGIDIPSPLGRIAFVNLDKPASFADNQTPKYGIALLVSKTDEAQKVYLKNIQEMCKLMIMDLWGDKAEERIKTIKRKFFADGDTPNPTSGKVYEGYPGTWVINARNPNPCGHSRGFKILNPGMMPDQFEAGMICRCTIQPYLNGDGFSYSLRAIKLIKDDGVRFGGAPDPSSVIDHLDDAAMAANANLGDMSVL